MSTGYYFIVIALIIVMGFLAFASIQSRTSRLPPRHRPGYRNIKRHAKR